MRTKLVCRPGKIGGELVPCTPEEEARLDEEGKVTAALQAEKRARYLAEKRNVLTQLVRLTGLTEDEVIAQMKSLVGRS